MTTTTTEELFARLQGALGPHYRLERELGRGGMGVVFSAIDTTLDRPVAVKVVHPELAAHDSIARRFLAEARMIARLRHPNIVAVHSAGRVDGLLYYVMDEVSGESLRQRLAREGRLPPEEVGRITADLAEALEAAGRAGLVHRDVKPENVLLDRHTGRALLADFGIARAMAGDADSATTGRGVAVGTPAYMSPEQAAGEEVDSRSDLYALGIVAYEMLAGRPPFEGPGRTVVTRQLTERPAPLERRRADVPRPLADAIMQALEKQPSRRWQTGGEFREALLGDRRARPSPVRRWRRTLVAAGAAVAIAVAAGVTIARNGDDGPPAGVNPRHSILLLPFDNLRQDSSLAWLRDGSVSMLSLSMSQWNDLTVVDHEQVHDLLAKHGLKVGDDIGLETARRLAREAGVWTVVLGDFDQAGDSLHLVARVYDVASGQRVDVARATGAPGLDVRPLFDALATRLLDLSGAPQDVRTDLAQATTGSLEAFRAYLSGVEALNHWDLAAAQRDLRRATTLDTTFGLAYYKLALTRGWLVGAVDSASDRAMLRATTYSSGLPAHERTVISAYAAFLRQDYTTARSLYQLLLRRDSTDADAWYGLGEAWFHDAGPATGPANWTSALRAFKRALVLDPEYALAYDHIGTMLNLAAGPGSSYALMPGDSFARVRTVNGVPTADSVVRTRAMQRARTEAVTLARNWVATQPTTVRAHGAMIDAYISAGDFKGAQAELERFREVRPGHTDAPFIEARIQLAAGQPERAATTLRAVLDSVSPADFRQYEGTPTVLDDIAAAANVFAYQGDLTNAAKAIDLTDRVRREVFPELFAGEGGGKHDEHWRRAVLGELYAAVGTPPATLRGIWQSAAEAARSAPESERKMVAYSGGPAALGLLIGVAGDSSAMTELRALTGEQPSKEVQALLAAIRLDTAQARRLLTQSDSGADQKNHYMVYRRPIAAFVHYLLGDYSTTLSMLDNYEPNALNSRGFDSRWGIMGRVRLLRAAAHEKLGHNSEARQEYRRALAQWQHADPALQPYIRLAEQGLARLGEPG